MNYKKKIHKEMKFIAKSFILGILFVGIAAPTQAQTSTELSEEEKNQLERRVEDKLEDFLIYLGELASKTLPDEIREAAYELNLKLFIGECEPYKVVDLYSGREQWKEAVRMQTSSINNSNINNQSMKDYFNKLKNNRSYTDIVIEQSGAVRVDNIRQVGPGKFEGVAHYFQIFAGYRDKRLLYKDRTEKSVKLYIDGNYVETSGGAKRVYDIRLGDMKVRSTEMVN